MFRGEGYPYIWNVISNFFETRNTPINHSPRSIPMNLAAVQAECCQRVQQELAQAISNQDWGSVSAIAPTLKQLSETLKNFQACMGQAQPPSFSQSWNARAELEKSLVPRTAPERAVPKVPSSYAWPDGFEGVTVGAQDDDAWQ